MVQNTKATVKTYSTQRMADFRAKILECHFGGMYLEIDGREVGVQFIGKFNVSNLLAVYGAAVMLGQDKEDVLVAMSTLHSVSGRLDPVHSPEGYTAIVDYAHTPDALENVLKAIHEVLGGKGQGDNRMRSRRQPRQGQAPAHGAGSREAERPRNHNERQPAVRGAAGHHRRHAGRTGREANEKRWSASPTAARPYAPPA